MTMHSSSKKPGKKKNRSKMAEIAALKQSKKDLEQEEIVVPTEEETKKALLRVINELEAGNTLQNILGLSDNLLEQIYTLAYSFYSQGNYQSAISLFQVLVSAKPECYKYNLGLSSCYHQLGMYEEAAFSFFLTFNIEPENPIPTYYIADSFLKADRPDVSNEFLDVTLALCLNKPEYNILKERCEVMKYNVEDILKIPHTVKDPSKTVVKKTSNINKKSKKKNKK